MVHQCDVLIVGGGPTGVTLAILLAQRGVKVVVAEKEADIYPLPRAAHLDHEVMRILQKAGVADEVMATSRQVASYDFLNAKGEVLLRFDGSDQIGPGGWPIANMIHQPSVEAALRRQLASYDNAQLQCQWEVASFEQDENGVRARVDTPQGEQTVEANYIVGADGARSPVRKASQITFEDLGFEEPWLVVDALVEDYARLPEVNLQICDPERPTTCVLMGEGRHRWEFMIKPGETADEVSDDGFIQELLKPWDVEGAIRLERKAVYTFRARIAREWRKGRVLLAGDAAHQTPPFAGQGMCSGLRDASNLAWKLAMVIEGQASDALLDTYQSEREPNLRATIEMAIMMGRTVCITDAEAAYARDVQMLEARRAGQAPDGAIAYPPISNGAVLANSPAAGAYFPQYLTKDGERLDNALGEGFALISQSDLSAPHLAPFAKELGDWLVANDAESVLVRPDGYVFGTGEAGRLKGAWKELSVLEPS